jgi:hypothetical protein
MTAVSTKHQSLHETQATRNDRNRRQEKDLPPKRPPGNSAQLTPKRPEPCTRAHGTRMLLPFATGKGSQSAGKMVVRLRRIGRRGHSYRRRPLPSSAQAPNPPVCSAWPPQCLPGWPKAAPSGPTGTQQSPVRRRRDLHRSRGSWAGPVRRDSFGLAQSRLIYGWSKRRLSRSVTF